MLTTKQAWRKIAEKMSDPNYRYYAGLCLEASLLREKGHITLTQCHEMRDHCASYIVPEEAWRGYWAYPHGDEREARILAALFFAEGA
jgi:hypothetical protein